MRAWGNKSNGIKRTKRDILDKGTKGSKRIKGIQKLMSLEE